MAERLRIVHIVGTLELGGIERLVTDWCLRLLGTHDVSVVCLLGKRGPFVEVLEQAGVRVVGFQRPASGLGMIMPLARTLRGLQPDVIHTHCAWSMFQQVLAAEFSGSGALVLTVHSQYRFGSRFAAVRRRVLARVWTKRVHSVVAISEAVNHWTQSWLGLKPASVTTIFNGVDLAMFSPGAGDLGVECGLSIPKDVPIVVAVGSLTEHKDVGMLIKACALIKQKGVDFRFLIIGEGPRSGVLEALSRDLGLAKEVLFLGLRSDIPSILRGSQVFVHGSKREGFGLVVAEAQACELPVVSTAVGGVPEIVEDGVTGLLVAVGDSVALAAAVTQLLDEPAMAREMGSRGRNRVEGMFSIERCLEQYGVLYEDAVAAR